MLLRRDLSEEVGLIELAADQERGWSIIETDTAARDWELRLVPAALHKLEKLTQERGASLLQRTEQLRRAVSGYIARLDSSKPFPDLIRELSHGADLKLLGVAQRVAWDVRHDEVYYGLAWLCITSYEGMVEEQPTTFYRQNPYTNTELMWRLHLVADWIASSQHLP
jgi:hypothetical protein